MRTITTTLRRRIIAAAPWLPWVLPGATGAVDAMNLAEVAMPVHLFVIAPAAAITAGWIGARIVSREFSARWELAAQKVQTHEIAKLTYQMHLEHCEAVRTAATEGPPQASDPQSTMPLRGLRVVQPPATGGVPAARVYTGKAKMATTVPTVRRSTPA